jgi:vesicle coat complex subunit
MGFFSIIERITPRFSHINPAVVFSAVKVIVKYLDYIKNPELAKNIVKRINPSLGKINKYIFFFFQEKSLFF